MIKAGKFLVSHIYVHVRCHCNHNPFILNCFHCINKLFEVLQTEGKIKIRTSSGIKGQESESNSVQSKCLSAKFSRKQIEFTDPFNVSEWHPRIKTRYPLARYMRGSQILHCGWLVSLSSKTKCSIIRSLTRKINCDKISIRSGFKKSFQGS